MLCILPVQKYYPGDQQQGLLSGSLDTDRANTPPSTFIQRVQ